MKAMILSSAPHRGQQSGSASYTCLISADDIRLHAGHVLHVFEAMEHDSSARGHFMRAGRMRARADDDENASRAGGRGGKREQQETKQAEEFHKLTSLVTILGLDGINHAPQGFAQGGFVADGFLPLGSRLGGAGGVRVSGQAGVGWGVLGVAAAELPHHKIQ